MDHSSGLEESQSGILPRAPDFVESSLEKMTDVVSTGIYNYQLLDQR